MEYYGREPSSDFFMHYGVKGMKWGVRRAIEKGNNKSLARHYKKAAKKLRVLDWKANPEEQMKYAKQHDKIAKAGLSVGLTGLGIATGAGFGHRILKNQYNKAYDAFYYPGWSKDAIKRAQTFESGNRELYDTMSRKRLAEATQYQNAKDNLLNYGNAAVKVQDIAGRVGSIGLGMGLGAKAVSANAKWRATKGNTKMVQNRNAWKKEMREAFKGTAYQNLPSYEKLRKKKKRR